jgi:hypothetical protein
MTTSKPIVVPSLRLLRLRGWQRFSIGSRTPPGNSKRPRASALGLVRNFERRSWRREPRESRSRRSAARQDSAVSESVSSSRSADWLYRSRQRCGAISAANPRARRDGLPARGARRHGRAHARTLSRSDVAIRARPKNACAWPSAASAWSRRTDGRAASGDSTLAHASRSTRRAASRHSHPKP